MRTRRRRRDLHAAMLAAVVVLGCGAAVLAPEGAATADPTTPVAAATSVGQPAARAGTEDVTTRQAPASRWLLPGDSTPTAPARTAAPEATPATPTPAGPTEPGPGKTVYLTFDDGPSPRWTRKVLRLLAWHDARATFFFLGASAKAHPRLARDVAEAGHAIGNHTYRHRDLRRLRKKQVRADLRRSQRAIRRATGVTPTCLRPPYGSTNRSVRAQARRLGLRTQLWDVDPRDWDRRNAGRISRATLRNVRDGSVVLLHDSGGDRRRTLHALPRILGELSARGFRFSGLCG